MVSLEWLHWFNSSGGFFILCLILTAFIYVGYSLKHRRLLDEKQGAFIFFYIYSLMSVVIILFFVKSNGEMLLFGGSIKDLFFPLIAGVIVIVINAIKSLVSIYRKG